MTQNTPDAIFTALHQAAQERAAQLEALVETHRAELLAVMAKVPMETAA